MDEAQGVKPISEKRLKFGFWFVRHKLLLKNMLIIVLFFLNLLFWGFIVFSLVLAFGSHYSSDQQMKMDVVFDRYVNIAGIQQLISPRDIQVVSIDTFVSDSERLDIIVLLKNTNTKWYATFDYSFTTAQGQTPKRKGFIMPGEQKYLMDLDVEVSTVQNVVLDNIIWTRENDFQNLIAERDRFIISNEIYTPKTSDENIEGNRATFTVTNNSNFNYYRPDFQIYLRSGNSIIAVHALTIDKLSSGESRDIDIRWYENLPSVQNIEVKPNINYLSSSSYISF